MPNVPKQWMDNAVSESNQYANELVAAGKYDFIVSKAWEETASTGTECIVLSLDIKLGTTTYKIYDRLWFTEKAAFKIHAFCKAAGLMSIIESGGSLTAQNCVQVRGVADVAVQDANGDYPERNIIANFLPKQQPTMIAPPAPVVDDDMPF
tara:strand:+ start:243 stop:695 length:453 start_codon:yes stop_codon:yes gene_type:complete